MKIFIIGSYNGDTKEEINRNIAKAVEAGKAIVTKGHLPFAPQSMFAFWEDTLDMRLIMKTCFAWIEQCDAVLVLNVGKEGGGTWSALEHAKKHGKVIFNAMSEIPNGN